MRKFNRIKMILCVTVVMIMCCACSVSSNTDMSMNTEGKGVFKTQVMLDKELLEVLSEYADEKEFDLVQAINEHKIDGVELDVEKVQKGQQQGVEISFDYKNTEEFEEIVGKFYNYIQTYAQNTIGTNDIEDNNVSDNKKNVDNKKEAFVNKSVNVYLEEGTFHAAVEEYLLNNGISVDKTSNTFRKFMKLFKSTIKFQLEDDFEDIYEENFEEEYYDDEDIDEDFDYEENFEEYDDGEEYGNDELPTGLNLPKDGYVIIKKDKDVSELKLHISALNSISTYVGFVVGTYNIGNEDEMFDLEEFDDTMVVDESRKLIFIQAFEQMKLADRIKESFDIYESNKTEYRLEDMTPPQIIDIFTEEYVNEINNVIDGLFKNEEVVDEDMDEYIGEDLYEDNGETFGPEFDFSYKVTFDNTTITLDNDNISEKCGKDGYITIISREKADKLLGNGEFDDTPSTADGFSLLIAVGLTFVAFIFAIVFYTKRKYM